MSCSGNCSSCGSDCQKQPLRHPNITGAILGQFMMEMAHRSKQNAAGEITEDVMDEMDRKTMNWLGATFSGQNGQFEIDPDWYPVGVAGNLRMKLGNELAQAANFPMITLRSFSLRWPYSWLKFMTRWLLSRKRGLNLWVKCPLLSFSRF